MSDWLASAQGLNDLDARSRARLDQLTPMHFAPGATLFRQGEEAQGYAIVLKGTIDVSLTGASGREIILYSVAPGQSCVQSTMGLLGDAPYSAEAKTVTPTELVFVPRGVFRDLMNSSESFRQIVFAAFGSRLSAMTHLLERIAFQKVEARIAQALLALSPAPHDTEIHVTHADLASRAGTAREVVSRRLEQWAKTGTIRIARGTVQIIDASALENISML